MDHWADDDYGDYAAEAGGTGAEAGSAPAPLDLSGLPLPPLLDPVLPATVENIDLSEVYDVITGMKRMLDLNNEDDEDEIRKNLQEDPDLLLAVIRVLHESNCLKRLVVDDETGEEVEETVALPIGPTPQLPPGVYSWLPQQQQQQQQHLPPAFPGNMHWATNPQALLGQTTHFDASASGFFRNR
jgi:hypothetical protein